MQPLPAGPRRLLPAVFVLVLVGALYLAARLPVASAAERTALASRFRFTELQIAMPPGLPHRDVRPVNPEYEHIRAWVSSVGAAIAINDLDGSGVANDICLVDPRSDRAIVTPAPGGGDEYAPFVLDPKPLPMNDAVAPMGCVPGDFNVDGKVDLLVYYWGRTPVLFLCRDGIAGPLRLEYYHPVELVPLRVNAGEAYHGQLWNTNAVSVADFDGDGYPDIGVFNYFPDSHVLDPTGLPDVQMNHSLSRAKNAGGAHILRWKGATRGALPSVSYDEQVAMDPAVSTGWTLAAASADIDGDLLPELYVANDFGQDRFFHNVSIPGRIRFSLVEGRRGVFTPKSLVVGHDSFKGMGIEFGDLDATGRFDMFVSNITTEWGLEESNFVWRNTAETPAQARAQLRRGVAPFDDAAAVTNLAWVGWGWDAKMADFDNDGRLELVQACGFVKGDINRWNWLQELAMSNDVLVEEAAMWPKAEPGDDIAGAQPLAFWVRQDNGRYANIGADLGFGSPTPSRGIAVSDVDGDGDQDFAVARQWGPPEFYLNTLVDRSAYLGLRLYRPVAGRDAGTGTPAYGAQVRLTTADGRTQVAQLDGGGGHSGKRSFDIFFGLGGTDQIVTAELAWRDLTGAIHSEQLQLRPGWHAFMLTGKAREVKVA